MANRKENPDYISLARDSFLSQPDARLRSMRVDKLDNGQFRASCHVTVGNSPSWQVATGDSPEAALVALREKARAKEAQEI